MRPTTPSQSSAANEASERSDPLPSGWFNWIPAFYRVPDTDVLNKVSIDGYLFLRYLKLLCIICGVGCILTWPVLLPMHRYGGNGSKQLDELTFGNITNPMWYYVHACQAWLFFGRSIVSMLIFQPVNSGGSAKESIIRQERKSDLEDT